jgi:predicted metal-dependent hydrolase
MEYKRYKEQARAYIAARIGQLNAVYGFVFHRISIKNQKTMWGSCSKKGNLNFNYRLIHLPTELADYVIVHELCHLKELNHSKRFWDLVGVALPEYPRLRRELKKHRIQ